jgi:hypothetical protein
MKKETLLSVLAAIMLLLGTGHSDVVFSEVNINVGISVPPPTLRISAPPPVTVIPGTYIYYPPDIAVDIFFYGGHWYRSHHGNWYRSDTYNGHWVSLAPERVPVTLVHLPPDYRRLPPGYRHHHIPYGEVKKNWRNWEKEKYWEKHGGRDWHGEKWAHDESRGRDKGRHHD